MDKLLPDAPRPTLVVCTKHRHFSREPSCGARGSKSLLKALIPLAQQAGVEVMPLPCLGECERGPNIKLMPAERLFHGVTQEALPMIVAEAAAWRPEGEPAKD